jgi:hypothetical protein
MNRANAPLLIALTTVLAASACMVTLPAPPMPATLTPNLAMTGKAQTLMAAPTATFTVTPILATDAPTITLTPFPSITPLPTATSTPTETPFGYFETPTPTSAILLPTSETPDPAEGYSNEGGDYTCRLAGKSLPDWTVLPARYMYKVSWTLINTGPKIWDSSVVIVWLDGNKLGMQKQYKFIKDVKAGQDAKAVVTIFTPGEAGHYRSVWALRSVKTHLVFCTFTLKIVIQ